MCKTKFGSFRGSPNLSKLLPEFIFRAIFDDEDALASDDASKISFERKGAAFLNNGAFGRAYDRVRELARDLRNFAEINPDVFYDQICLELICHTSQIASEFFCSRNVLLVPNCSIGLKSVLESLVRSEKSQVAAYLAPIYGATQKLLHCFKDEGQLLDVLQIAPGGEKSSLTEEDPQIILGELVNAYRKQKFNILFCDETASQSGRILPLEVVSQFCRNHGVILVVDGTQSCQLLLEENKQKLLDEIDYFVMSTHKWLCNVKTCGIIRFREGVSPPHPPAISFGWNLDSGPKISVEEAKSRFLWIGMLDSYISYITLGKALQIFSKHGKCQAVAASTLMTKCFKKILKVQPMLEMKPEKIRIMNIFMLDNPQFESLADVTKIQNAMQDYGVFVSVKKFGRDCGSKELCNRKEKFYLRVSAWSYNNEGDFETLAFTLTNNLRLSSTTTDAMKLQFLFVYDMYEKLFSVLKPEAFFIRAERLRHHLIFYYGHTAAFYINKLIVSSYIRDRIDPRLESTLSVGVDEMSWDDLLEDNYDWSPLTPVQKEEYIEIVRDYRQKVRHLVLTLLDDNPVKGPIVQGSLHWVLLMGMEHEKIHLETSAVIVSQVPTDLIKQCHDFNVPTYLDKHQPLCDQKPENVPKNVLVPVPGGCVRMGKDNLEQDIYGWDNEFGHEERLLKNFEASQMLVSNAEFLEFVREGGYEEVGRKWWSTEGWKYVTDMKVSGPRFWVGQTHCRLMLKVVPMPWDFPVEVNNLEAEAFCNWKSHKLGKKLRLISHEESFHMRQMAENEVNNNNLNKFASPVPVNLFGGKIDGHQFFDISGNVWQHSVSVLTVMDGFKVDRFYDDFTLPTIDGFHNHILGGSWISLGNCANLNARYGFRRHFYQFCGIRYVCSNNDYHRTVPKIFDEITMTKHITEHYGQNLDRYDGFFSENLVENWPAFLGSKSSEIIIEEIENRRLEETSLKVLIVHGSAGRTTLELLRQCSNLRIDHTDQTANLLQVLETLIYDSKIQWYHQVEGKICQCLEYLLRDEDKNGALLDGKNNKVHFYQADYKNMRPFLNEYDVVIADFRYKNSELYLNHVLQRLKTGGLLILASIDNFDDVRQTGVERVEFAAIKKSIFGHIQQENKNEAVFALSHLSTWRKLLKNGTTPQFPESLCWNNNNDEETILTFHFGDDLFSIKNFHLRLSELCVEFCRRFQVDMNKGLVAECGPGRLALELEPHFNYVEAYDSSKCFINVLQQKIRSRNVQRLNAHEGNCYKQAECTDVRKFEVIIGSNLIENLEAPAQWILQSKAMLEPRGLLIITSTCCWREDKTPFSNWIGGYKRNAENFDTLDGLKELLMPELELLQDFPLPLVTKNPNGTYQLNFSKCMIFGTRTPSL